MRTALLLPTPQLANAVADSEAFDDVGSWTATRSSVSANSTAGPFGASTADTLTEDATAANSHILNQMVALTKPGPHLIRVWAKPNGREVIRLSFAASTTADFNLTTGVATVTGALAVGAYTVPALNGFFECVMKVNAAGGTINLIVFLMNPGISYNGDGVSGVFLGGAMVHPGFRRAPYRATA